MAVFRYFLNALANGFTMNHVKEEFLLKCEDCGKAFFTLGEKTFYEEKGLALPKRCKVCREQRKLKWKESEENQRKEKERVEFEKALSQVPYKVLLLSDFFNGVAEETLYVLGNGFDLMHGVKSSYYNFRDSLGKRNPLRNALETYLQVNDLWADFENALGNLDCSAMYDTLDMWLEDFGAYDEDAQAADYFCAIDAASTPSDTIMQDLPRRFQMWVDSLRLKNENKILENIILPYAKFLTFNYTEFAETLYHIPPQNICYIHGCRKKKKGRPREKLILGHIPDAVDMEWGGNFPEYKSRHADQMFYDATQLLAEKFNWYSEAMTKDTQAIIKEYANFFDGLENIKNIVVIGHSLSKVDWGYFRQIIRCNKSIENVEWIFSCYNKKDLERIEVFLKNMDIHTERVKLLRI